MIQQKPVLRINPTLEQSMNPGAIKIIWAARSLRDEQLPHVCAAPLVRMVCMTQREHFGYCSKSIQLTIGSRNRGDMGLFSLHASFQAEQTGIIFSANRPRQTPSPLCQRWSNVEPSQPFLEISRAMRHGRAASKAKPAPECMDDHLWTIAALNRGDSCRQVDLDACHGLLCSSRPGQAAAHGSPHSPAVGAAPSRPCRPAMVVDQNDASRFLIWVSAPPRTAPAAANRDLSMQQQPGEEVGLDVAVLAPHPKHLELRVAPSSYLRHPSARAATGATQTPSSGDGKAQSADGTPLAAVVCGWSAHARWRIEACSERPKTLLRRPSPSP